MIIDMGVNDHPAAPQAFTTFRVPSRLLEVVLMLIVAVIGLHTLWEAATATGSFSEASGLVRAAVVVGVGYLAVRSARAGLERWRQGSGIGPAIERIEQ
ncbi:hypothetical protein [Mycobacterium sp. SMC-17]|uniref:hypothetical protein n=1 Tax=Mycobacterium sp. SMC-17 TaxID=3381628 RepID=UPI0038766AD7